MKKIRKVMVTSLTAFLLLSAVSPAMAQEAQTRAGSAAAAAAPFKDTAGSWASSSIARWASNGVINGYADGTFKPGKRITRAEFVTVLNKLFGYTAAGSGNFSDVPASAWYSDELAAAKAAGYYQGFSNNRALPNSEITRQDAVTLLARVFELSASSGQAAAFTDSDQISGYAKEAAAALSDAVKGYADGTFRPRAPITRAETAALLDRLVSGYYPAAGEQTAGTVEGNAVIPRTGVVLQDSAIHGNLYLTAGIGSGEAKLEAVTVQGKTLVEGGGEHTVTFSDSVLNTVDVKRQDGRVRVLAEGSTRIAAVQVNSGSTLELDGSAVLESVTLNKPEVISLGAGTVIKKLVINESAANSVITGSGNIESITVGASGITLNGSLLTTAVTAVKGGSAVRPSPAASAGTGSVGGGSTASPSPAASPSPTVSPSPTAEPEAVVNLADKGATAETRSLFQYLNEIRGSHILFGHQHATDEALSAPVNGVVSDTYAATGDNPALYGWDTLSLEGYEKPGSTGNSPEQNRDNLVASMKAAYESGGVLTLSSHMPNFVTGGDFYDTSGNVVSHILPGGDKNAEFNAFLDRIADFALHLKDDNGKAIPVIYRPFHEQNGSWFWWGAAYTTSEQYAEIYRYTVEYLRDVKGVHNFLYAFSPGSPFNGLESTFLKTYPGDDYVDILGFDTYYDGTTQGWFDTVLDDAKLISRLADDKGKVAAFTEFGYSNVKPTGTADLQFFTKLIAKLQSDPDAKRMAYMLTWANFGYNSIFVPYHNSVQYGDHELLPDFQAYYQDDYTYFDRELNGVYNKTVATEEERPFLHIASPIAQDTIRTASAAIRARVLEEQPSKVVYLVQGSDEEHGMTRDSEGYYSADWQPDAEWNGKGVELTVKAYADNGSSIEQTITVYVGIPEMTVGQLTFDSGIDGVQNNGTWSQSGNLSANFSHAVLEGDGKLQIGVTDLVYTDTWQELKIGLPGIADAVNLKQVNRVAFDIWIPLEAAARSAQENLTATVLAAAELPPASDKYQSKTSALSALDTVTVGDAVYGKYAALIDLTDSAQIEAATGLSLAIVGSGLDYNGPVYVDNIRLINAYSGENGDPALIDNYESYKGSDQLLRNAYSANGDTNSISLDSGHTSSGSYALKLDYTIAGQGYTGVTKSLDNLDWSSAGRLKFWLVPDGSGKKLVIQIKANGVSFEAYPPLSGTAGQWVEIPFKDFTVASWDTANAGKKLDTVNAKNIQAFSIYVNAQPGDAYTRDNPFKSTLYFDDIQVIPGAEGDIPDGTDTGSGGDGGLPAGTLYGFETSAGSWAIGENTSGAASPALSADAASEGTRSLAASFSLDPAGSYFLLGNNESLNLSGAKTLTAKVKVSAGTANVSLYIQTGSGWAWTASAPVTVDSSGFATVTLSLAGLADLDAVKALGLKVEPASGSGTATLYLDEVAITK